MSFVSPEFALLCLLFFPAYWSLAHQPRAQRCLLIACAYALYATWVPLFAVVLAVYSTVIWALGRWMQRAASARLPVALGLWLAGSFLFSLKYYEFVRETFQAILQHTGFVSLLPVLNWVAPVGVSFFTFQAVSYLVMVGRAPTLARSWPDVLLFLSFWPTLFAGPIWRAEQFFAQTDRQRPARRVGSPRQGWLALYLIALGLVQKVVLASWLSAQVVDPVYKSPDQYASVSLAAAMLGYSLQIFLDFAGYTLIVTGLALLLGYRLPVNFRQPYLARNLSDFWTRWHVSLSSFIRDSIGGQPPGLGPNAAQCVVRHVDQRFVARCQLDFCGLGFVAWARCGGAKHGQALGHAGVATLGRANLDLCFCQCGLGVFPGRLFAACDPNAARTVAKSCWFLVARTIALVGFVVCFCVGFRVESLGFELAAPERGVSSASGFLGVCRVVGIAAVCGALWGA
jgi:hypothetical protein